MRRLLVGLALCGRVWADAPAWSLDVGVSEGYNHYQATDLNAVMVLLERTTREASGFNHYDVKGFDGHPATQLFLGATRGDWRVGLEAEFWTETFQQTEVPFDAAHADRKFRVTCDEVRAQADSGRTGCLDAREVFRFVPITLQASWMPRWTPWLRAGGGYGIGILAGSADITLSTQYFGPEASPPDRITLGVVPSPLVTWVHKFWATAEFLPWDWLGVELRGGWRYTEMGGVKIDSRSGKSQVLDLIFNSPKEGDRLYVRNPSGTPEQTSLFIGSPQAARAQTRYDFHQVTGDFSGWFLALGLNAHWSL